ncbi:hypothetical protein SLE2022_017790 [Rubroshorea leprosula]
MSRTKGLSALFRAAAAGRRAGDAHLPDLVNCLDAAVPSSSTSIKHSVNPPEPAKSSRKRLGNVGLSSQLFESSLASEDSSNQLKQQISFIICDNTSDGSPDSGGTSNDNYSGSLDIPWLELMSNKNLLIKRKLVSRERKQKWVFKMSQVPRFKQLIKLCGEKLGSEATLQVFGKLGRKTGVKEYNSLIAMCVDMARTTDDEDVALVEMSKAYRIFEKMREQGYQLDEGTYGPLLMYFIERGMIEEFHFFCGSIKDGNPNSLPRLGYYEMLLWISVDNEEMIQQLCDYIAADDEENIQLKENYLLALSETQRTNDLLRVLEIIDITKFSDLNTFNIFKLLGRLSLESLAEKFLLALKSIDGGSEKILKLIFSYASCIPNLAVEDVVLKFESLCVKFEIRPSLESYQELIKYCCGSHKVQMALDIVDRICEDGLSLSIDTLNCILNASEENYEYNLVWRIYSVICHHNLKPNAETFRSMINLSVKMKDFDGAYAMLNDSKKMNIEPVASMYNAIMAGYFREKNISAGLRVLKQMKLDGVKPDPQTYSYLIGFCDSEKDIIKYYNELKCSGIPVTKHIFMSLVNAYAACGQFEKAKQVLLDERIPVKILNELKSVLISALASNGQMADALDLYEKIKQAGGNLEPKAVISLIEYLHSQGDLNLMLQLLEELHDQGYWIDGCCRVVTFCVRKKHLSTAIDLLKQLKDKFCDDELAAEVLFDETFAIIAEEEPADVQFGVDLLQAIKINIGISPSRKCLDFLLNACVKAKDLQNSLLVWEEYKIAGLPYNVLNFLRMYQALLACGDHKSAEVMQTKIPKDDPDVRDIIKAFQVTYPHFLEGEKEGTYAKSAPAKANKKPQVEEKKKNKKKKKKKKKPEK